MVQTIEIVKTVPITNVITDLENLLSEICNNISLQLSNNDYPALNISGTPPESLLDAATLDGKLPGYYDITSHSINDLADVNTTGVSDGYILIWNNTTLKWEAKDLILSLNDISNVKITNPSNREILIYEYNTGNWINSTLSAAGISTVDHLHDNRYLKLTGGTITGNLTVNGSLKVNNISASSNYLTIGNNLTVNGGLTVNNNLVTNGGLSVSGSSTINGSLTVSNDLTINGNITTAGNLKITGSTKVGGSFYSGTTSPSNTTRLNYDGYFYATKLVSTATTGTAPLAVSSTTAVINLNTDMVDGKHAVDFIDISTYTAKGDLLVASNASTPTKLSVGNDGDVLIADSDSSTGVKWGYPTVKEIIKSSTTTLTTAEITGTIINNYGQSADVTLTLPAAAKGLTFMVIFGTQVSKYFRIQPNTNNQIYLNGIGIGNGKYVGVSSVTAGNAISFSSFQTGSSAYDWLAVPISGNWVAQA